MKKILILLTAAAMLSCLFACKAQDDTHESTTPTQATSTAQTISESTEEPTHEVASTASDNTQNNQPAFNDEGRATVPEYDPFA